MIVSKKLIAIIIFLLLITATAIVLSQQNNQNDNEQDPNDDDPNNNDDNPDDPNNPNTPKKYYTLSTTIQGNGIIVRNPNQGNYEENTTILLTAKPSPGWYFDHWEGNVNSTKSNLNITITQNLSLTAVFTEGGYSLSIQTVGTGLIYIDHNRYDEDNNFAPGTTVEVFAQGNSGYQFDHWEGDITGTQNPINVTIENDMSFTAHFEAGQYQITLKTDGEGTVTKTPDKSFYQAGEQVTITAEADPGSRFTRFSGTHGYNSDNNPYTLTIQTDLTITAEFTQEVYTVTTQINGNGTIDKDPDQREFEYGDTLTLIAYPDENFIFNYWKDTRDNSTFSGNPYTLIIDQNTTIIVNFTTSNQGYSLATLKKPSNATGTIKRTPDQNRYDSGTTVSLTAISNVNWSFSHWTGALNSTQPQQTLIIDEDKTVTAHFIADGYNITTQVDGQGDITITPQQASYMNGTEITLTAHAETGWTFDHWSGNLSGNQNPATLIMDDDKSVTAHFIPLVYNLSITIHGNGTTTPSEGNHSYAVGTELTISSEAFDGSYFNYYNLNGEHLISETFSLTITNHTTLDVYFISTQQSYHLNITIEGQGSVLSTPLQNYYHPGQNVSLHAQEEGLWAFTNWTGDYTSTSRNIQLTMDSDKSVTAHFTEGLVLSLSIVGNGNINPYSTGQHILPRDSTLTLTANPDDGWKFSSWNGTHNSTENPFTFNLSENTTLTAIFTLKEYNLNLTIVGGGDVRVEPDLESYPHGTQVSLIPIQGPGNFYRWEGDFTGNQHPITITMDEDKTIRAYFATSDMQVSGNIYLTDIEPGSSINSTIRIGNNGEEGSRLSWEARVNANWGIWVMNTTSGSHIRPGESVTINITIDDIPDKKKSNFEGIITFTNTLDPSDTHDVFVSITTSYQRNPILSWLQHFFNDLLSQFPLLDQFFDTLQSRLNIS